MTHKSSHLNLKPASLNGRSSNRPSKIEDWDNRTTKRSHYGSDGVRDNDIFQLPTSDYKLLLVLTSVAAIVRLFRIYQPSSVVFDEVQCVFSPCPTAL